MKDINYEQFLLKKWKCEMLKSESDPPNKTLGALPQGFIYIINWCIWDGEHYIIPTQFITIRKQMKSAITTTENVTLNSRN